MTFRRKFKFILFILSLAVLIPCAFVVWNESFYFDMVKMRSPVKYSGELPVRYDFRGNGNFGARRNGHRRHQGLDILAPLGTPVIAAKGGMAVSCENKKGMGKFIRIKHKNGLMTIYGHLSKICIKPVQMVRQGQIIGEVGNTGNARYNGITPHLHFEVRQYGVAVDPKEYLCE